MLKNKKKIVCGITGHTGSIGRNLIKNYKKKVIFYPFKGDITNKKQILKWVKSKKFNYLIHLAAIVPIKEVNSNRKKAFNVNTLGTKNLVDVIIKEKKKIDWVFFASTSHVYSSSNKKISENAKIKPISYYGKTKFLAENEISKLKKNGTKVCIGRIFSTTNNYQRKNYLVPDLKNKIKKAKRKIILKNLNHFRDFISIKDIIKIILYFLKINYFGIINISSGKKTKLSDIAKIIAKYYKKEIVIKNNISPTSLLSDNSLLKRKYKFKLNTNIKTMIFND